MLGIIVHHSAELVTFISLLSLALYQPQIRHLIHLVDALLTCNSRKTLTNLYRQFAAHLDPKTAADFFRESPWQAEDINCKASKRPKSGLPWSCWPSTILDVAVPFLPRGTPSSQRFWSFLCVLSGLCGAIKGY